MMHKVSTLSLAQLLEEIEHYARLASSGDADNVKRRNAHVRRIAECRSEIIDRVGHLRESGPR